MKKVGNTDIVKAWSNKRSFVLVIKTTPVVLISGIGEFGIRIDSKFGVVKSEKSFSILNEKFEAFLSDGSVRQRDAAGHLEQKKVIFLLHIVPLLSIHNKELNPIRLSFF